MGYKDKPIFSTIKSGSRDRVEPYNSDPTGSEKVKKGVNRGEVPYNLQVWTPPHKHTTRSTLDTGWQEFLVNVSLPVSSSIICSNKDADMILH